MGKMPHPINRPADRSDVKSLLVTIEDMFRASQNTLNIYSRTSLLLAISIEAKMLLMKLNVMKKRWVCHLPFKEACTVDFYDWSKKIEKMSLTLVGPDETSEADGMPSEYCPSKHFMLDLYTMLPENAATEESPAYYCELDINKLVNNQDKILKLITKKWPDYRYKFSELVAQKVNDRTGGAVQPLADHSINIQMACCEVLQELSATLYELYDMPKGVIQRDQFARLAERVVNESEYGGRKAQKSAQRDVDNLKNTTPEDEWDQRREEEIQASIDFINELKYGRQVFTFLGRNYDINGHYAGLGRFFNSIRRDISTEELSLLIEQLYRLLYLLEDRHQSAPKPSVASPREEQPVSSNQSTPNPQTDLPMFFTHALRNNAEAANLLMDIIKKAGPYMACNLTKQQREQPEAKPYVDWKWNHLMQVFVELDLIVEKTKQIDFAEFLVSQLPDRKTGNILQSLYRNNDNRDPEILADVKAAFRPLFVPLRD